MTFESKGLFIVAIYMLVPPESYVIFLTTLVISILIMNKLVELFGGGKKSMVMA